MPLKEATLRPSEAYCSRESGGPQAVHQRYTHQLRVLSSTFAKLLIPNNCTFRLITVAFPCVSVTYCFKSELIIPWSQVRVLLGPPPYFSLQTYDPTPG